MPIAFSKHREILTNSFWQGINTVAKQGATFLIFILSAHFLAPEDFGLLNYLMAVLAILIIFSDFGLSAATTKYVAEHKAKKSDSLEKILFSVSIVVIGVVFLVSLFVLCFGKAIFAENYKYIIYFLPYLFFVPLVSVIDGVYRGEEQFKKLSIISIIIGFFSVIASYFLIQRFLFVGVIISQNLLYLFLALFLFALKDNVAWKFDKKILKKIIKYGLVIGFSGIAYFMYNKVDILVLKHFDYIKEIGYYEIINKLFLLATIPVIILGQVLAPTITRDYAHRQYIRVKERFLKHLLLAATLSVIASAILYFIFPILIDVFLNKYFTEETMYMFKLLILIFPFTLTGLLISQGHTLATGNAHFSLWTLIVAGVGNVIFDFYFISKFGFIGVVYSTLIFYPLEITTFISLYFRKLNLLIKQHETG